MNRLTPALKLILFINLLVFALIYFNLLPGGLLALYYPTMYEFQPYQIISSFFTHFEIWHLAFNMMSLYSIGSMLEYRWKSPRFLNFYLLCGIGGGLFYLLTKYVMSIAGDDPSSICIGASGAVFGLFTAMAMIYPDMEFMLFFIPFPIKARKLWLGLVGIDIFFGLINLSNDNIGHWAHIGGVISALILLKFYLKERISIF